MNEAGLRKPLDLIQFPWEKDTPTEQITDADRQELLDLMANINAQNAQPSAPGGSPSEQPTE